MKYHQIYFYDINLVDIHDIQSEKDFYDSSNLLKSILIPNTTGPTLFEVQAKWVLRVPTQFAFLSARNLSAAQLSSNQAFSFNISRLRKEMLTFNT